MIGDEIMSFSIPSFKIPFPKTQNLRGSGSTEATRKNLHNIKQWGDFMKTSVGYPRDLDRSPVDHQRALRACKNLGPLYEKMKQCYRVEAVDVAPTQDAY